MMVFEQNVGIHLPAPWLGVAHFKTSADSSVKGQTTIDQFEPKYTMHDYNPKKALGIIESMGSP